MTFFSQETLIIHFIHVLGLMEYLFQTEPQFVSQNGTYLFPKNFTTFLNSCLLSQMFYTKLWHDRYKLYGLHKYEIVCLFLIFLLRNFWSDHIFTQFNQLGFTSSNHLINKNITKFEQILELNEQTLALITGKSLIFATKLIEAVKKLPKFEVTWSLANRKETFVKNDQNSIWKTGKIMILSRYRPIPVPLPFSGHRDPCWHSVPHRI